MAPLDLILLGVVAVVTWLVASDGPWSAAITLVAMLTAGLVAMNLFEPLAGFLSRSVLTSYEWQNRWDVIALLGIFAGGVFGLRALADYLLPTYAPVNALLYDGLRWGLGVVNGYVLVAILLTAVHVAPLPREFLGFTPERANFFGLSPDIQWLAFNQYASEHALRRLTPGGEPVIFDGARAPANPAQPATMQVWSSFPIRYAARRQQYFSGGQPVAAGGGAVPAPPPSNTPRAAPNSGTGGF